jgi:ribose 5-phosphate isomerase A
VAQKLSLDQNEKKRLAAVEACKLVKPGMVLGLGTGSTVQFALEELSRQIKAGLKIKGISTSSKTDHEAKRLNIPLTTLDENPRVDLTIDGADEVDSRLNLVKGGGGALVREKVVAESSRVVAIIADDSKFVAKLGTTFPIPVEVLPFARVLVERGLHALGATPSLRLKDGKPYVTDNHCWIIDARFPGIDEPNRIESEITMLPGVVDCGIFTGLADIAFIGFNEGVRRFQLPRQVRATL